MKRGYRQGLVGLLLLGALMWTAGALNLFAGTPLLSLAILVAGGLLTVTAGFLLMASRPSGRLDHRPENAVWFCASFGIGLASVGLAVSPLTHWQWPALVFAAGGVGLMAWAPQAFGRKRA